MVENYEAIRQASNNPRVVVVGYPRIFPADYEDVYESELCTLQITRAEIGRLKQLQDQFETTIRNSAASAGVRFVSTMNLFKGHDICSSDSWFVPVVKQGAGHPTAVGQARIASLLRGWAVN